MLATFKMSDSIESELLFFDTFSHDHNTEVVLIACPELLKLFKIAFAMRSGM